MIKLQLHFLHTSNGRREQVSATTQVVKEYVHLTNKPEHVLVRVLCDHLTGHRDLRINEYKTNIWKSLNLQIHVSCYMQRVSKLTYILICLAEAEIGIDNALGHVVIDDLVCSADLRVNAALNE